MHRDHQTRHQIDHRHRWRELARGWFRFVPGSGSAQATIVLLALVLALDAADRSAVGALAPSLKDAFGIDNTQIGLLAAAFSIVGSLATLPMGVLADRVTRVTLIGVSVAVWSLVMGSTAAAVTFTMLFATRMALGILTAAAGPPVSSLIGDLYPVDVRGRVMAWVRSGELVGSGFGFLVSGLILVLFSWRGVFVAFALAGLVVAFQIARRPEPRRASGDEIQHSSEHDQTLYDLIDDAHVEPFPHTVLRGSQRDRSLRWALAYTLRIRTVVVVIIAGSLGTSSSRGSRCSRSCSPSTSTASLRPVPRSSSRSSAPVRSWVSSAVAVWATS